MLQPKEIHANRKQVLVRRDTLHVSANGEIKKAKHASTRKCESSCL
jgi:hypothetical protein